MSARAYRLGPASVAHCRPDAGATDDDGEHNPAKADAPPIRNYLTNNSMETPRHLAVQLAHSGITMIESNSWTFALATAQFLSSQRPHGSAFVIGESGLTTALHEAGYTLVDRNPDYVMIGKT